MINARRAEVKVTYDNVDFVTTAGADAESISYIDSASDNSDSIELTINATKSKWINSFMPEKGAKLIAKIVGRYWTNGKGTKTLSCGSFTLDDISYDDAPSTLTVGGVAKPEDQDFSELERDYIWQNTSIKRIGQTIADRYGLSFSYDAEDYDIECDEQSATDSSYYNTLCGYYGLILKVYADSLWVYDREAYKAKLPVKTFNSSNIKRGSLSWNTTLSGTFTGGDFSYTDPDKDIDIICTVGGGSHTKSVNRRATSVYDAAVQLCAEINNANHGSTTVKFTSANGEFSVCSGNTIELEGYGKLDGKYFVDKITHKYSSSGGFTSALECSLCEEPFYEWQVGGEIVYHETEEESDEEYATSSADNSASAAAGAVAGAAVTLNNAPFYYTSIATEPSCYKSGVFYFYDAILIAGRYRITNSASRCGKLPVGENVTGWVPASYCGVGDAGDTTNL